MFLLVGTLYATFSIFIRSFFDGGDGRNRDIARIFELAYLILLFTFILMSITKPIEKSRLAYTCLTLIFGAFVFVSLGFGLRFFYDNERINRYTAGLIGTSLVGVYLVPYILNCFKINFFTYWIGVFMLLFLSPLYINIFIIYSMCNLHDISWGNRDTNHKNANDTQKALEQFRALYLIIWLSLNTIYGYGLIYLNDTGDSIYVLSLSILVSLVIVLKLICSVIHVLYDCCSRFKVRRKVRERVEESKVNPSPAGSQYEDYKGNQNQDDLDSNRRRSRGEEQLDSAQNEIHTEHHAYPKKGNVDEEDDENLDDEEDT